MKKIFLYLLTSLLLLTFGNSARAQRITLVEKTYTYTNTSTGSSTSDWAHYFLVGDEKTPQKAGYFGQHLRKLIQSDTQAVKYLNSYATRQGFKLATSIATVVLFSTFAISNLSKESVSPQNFDKPEKNRGMLYASFGTLAINLVFRIVPPKSIQNAVNTYNKNNDSKLSFNSMYIDSEKVFGVRNMAIGVKFNLNTRQSYNPE